MTNLEDKTEYSGVNHAFIHSSHLSCTKQKDEYGIYLEFHSNGEVNKGLCLLRYEKLEVEFIKYIDGLLYNY